MAHRILRLGSGDVDAYRAIRLEALHDAPEAFGADYDAAAEKSADHFRALLETLAVFGGFDAAGALDGIVAFVRLEGAKYRHRGEMVSMYVRPAARGTGLGLALIETLLDHARHHVLQVHLGVGTYNQPAIRLYRKAGFAIYGTEPRSLFVNGRFIDEYQMVRFLDKAPGRQNENE